MSAGPLVDAHQPSLSGARRIDAELSLEDFMGDES